MSIQRNHTPNYATKPFFITKLELHVIHADNCVNFYASFFHDTKYMSLKAKLLYCILQSYGYF